MIVPKSVYQFEKCIHASNTMKRPGIPVNSIKNQEWFDEKVFFILIYLMRDDSIFPVFFH